MKHIRTFVLEVIVFVILQSVSAQEWKGNWITAFENQNATNTWIAYHKTLEIPKVPAEAMARLAVDSKYWLWINGELVVFECLTPEFELISDHSYCISSPGLWLYGSATPQFQVA